VCFSSNSLSTSWRASRSARSRCWRSPSLARSSACCPACASCWRSSARACFSLASAVSPSALASLCPESYPVLYSHHPAPASVAQSTTPGKRRVKNHLTALFILASRWPGNRHLQLLVNLYACMCYPGTEIQAKRGIGLPVHHHADKQRQRTDNQRHHRGGIGGGQSALWVGD